MKEKYKKIITNLLILGMMLIVSISSILLGYVIGKDHNMKKQTVPITKEELLGEKGADKLYHLLYDDADCGASVITYYQYGKVIPDMMKEEDKNRIVVRNLVSSGKSIGKTEEGNYIYTEEEVNKIKNQILGSSTSFEIIDKEECSYLHKLEDGTYSVQTECEGKVCSSNMVTQFEKTERKGNKIYLNQMVVFKQETEQEVGVRLVEYFSDYDKTNLIAKEALPSGTGIHDKNSFDFDKYKDSVGKYQYTFEVNDDNTFTFLQLERIK